MTRTFWVQGIVLTALLGTISGCGGEAKTISTKEGSFAMIEGAVNDICDRVLDPKYKGSRDLGSDSDRMGLALNSLFKATEGTPIAADAEEIKKGLTSLESMVASRAPIDKQREAAKALKAKVEAAKAKL